MAERTGEEKNDPSSFALISFPKSRPFETMRGKRLFLFAVLGAVGNLRFASTPRCRSLLPAFYSMTLVGAGGLSTRVGNATMRMREGTGRKFGNMILANVSTHPCIRIENCTQSSTDTPSTLPASTVSLSMYLFFTSKNIIESPTAGFSIESPSTGTAPSICSNACFHTGCECHLHRSLFMIDAFSIAPTFATRASSDQVECERNVFAEPVANTCASQSPDASTVVGTKLTCNLNDGPVSLVFIRAAYSLCRKCINPQTIFDFPQKSPLRCPQTDFFQIGEDGIGRNDPAY